MRLAPSLVLLLSLAACGETADQACTDEANASCARLEACHTNGIELRYGDLATCQARLKASCLAGLSAPSTGRTVASVIACAMALPSASCDSYLEGTVNECKPPAGTLAAGAPCAFAAQCQSAFCSYVPGAACGTCAAQPAAGASCATSQCGAGLVCAKATQTCQPVGADGAACTTTSECTSGDTCVGGSATTMTVGRCTPAGEAVGTTCDRMTGPGCDPLKGLYCSAPFKVSAGTCTMLSYAMPGQPCGLVPGTATTGDTVTECIGRSSCILPAGKLAGTCVAYAADGAACDTVAGPDCLAPARCVTGGSGTAGTCQLTDGGSCK